MHEVSTFTKRIASPFVKWVGGKRSIMDHLLAYLPPSFGHYFEPFVGGGALFFALAHRLVGATLVDHNFELAITYLAVKKDPNELIARLRGHEALHSHDYYYQVRATEPVEAFDMAARFIYLNKTCFNGLYRVNKSGKFNAPIGRYTRPNIVQEENILACAEALKLATIRHGDFETIGDEVAKGDLVYFDPPYHPTSETSFTEYTEQNFTERDQVRLRDLAQNLHRRGAFVMVSNSDTRLIQDLYRHRAFHKRVVRAPRYVNCKPGERSVKARELLITNF